MAKYRKRSVNFFKDMLWRRLWREAKPMAEICDAPARAMVYSRRRRAFVEIPIAKRISRRMDAE
jgi:hypothetical protein